MKGISFVQPFECKEERRILEGAIKELEEEVIKVIKNDYNEFKDEDILVDEYLERVVETKSIKDDINEIQGAASLIKPTKF